MKKILLIAMTVMLAGVASAQPFSSDRSTKVLSARPLPAMMQAKIDGGIKAAPQMHSRISRGNLNLGNKLNLSQKVQQSIRLTPTAAAKVSPRKAGALQSSYLAIGTNHYTNSRESWTMKTGTLSDSGDPALIDMLPTPDDLGGKETSIAVPYTVQDDEIVIQPTVIGEVEDEDGSKYYIILFSAMTEDGCIYIGVDENGKLTVSTNDYLVYGAWEQPEYQYDDEEEELVGYLGYVSMYTRVQYLGEGEIPVPEARYEPASTYYHIGSSSSGYGYIANLAVVPPYAPLSFNNLTEDMADTWSWSMTQLEYNSDIEDYEDVEVFTAATRNFSIKALPGAYSPASLTASYSGEEGEAFKWGLPYEYNGNSYDAYVYGGELTSMLIFSDETEATLTRANTKDFGYYYSGSFLTPGLSERDYAITTLISYQGKPAAPLYITGIHFGVYQLKANDDFNLKCKIQKMSFDENGRVVLGDVLAESEITYDDLGDISDGSFDWTSFYVEDEWGMTEEIDHLFVEDEFAVVIEGWDNGTFECYSLIDGCEFGNVANTYFIEAGDEEEAIYHYTSNYQHLDLGIYGGWGYLHTEDETNLLFGPEGGESSLHIDPMLYSTDGETSEPTYSLYIESITEDEEELDELPEWLTIEVANEHYEKNEEGRVVDGLDYDLVLTAEALPEGVSNRQVQIVFFQAGAKLTLTVTQDVDPDGIRTVVESTPFRGGRAFNLAGQPVGKTFKGVAVKDGKKVLVK